MPGKYELLYGDSRSEKDGDLTVTADGSLVVGRTPKAAVAINAAMAEPATPPFDLARKDKDLSLVIHFQPYQVHLIDILKTLNSFVPFEDES